jgi:hypothetical protein
MLKAYNPQPHRHDHAQQRRLAHQFPDGFSQVLWSFVVGCHLAHSIVFYSFLALQN